MLPPPPVIVPRAPAPRRDRTPDGPPEVKEKGRGRVHAVVLALMAEAFLSRISSGLIKTAVPLYALLVFGLDITAVMGLVLIQNVVPLLLRPFFGSLADKYGKKKVFIVSLTIRTAVRPALRRGTIAAALRNQRDSRHSRSANGPSA